LRGQVEGIKGDVGTFIEVLPISMATKLVLRFMEARLVKVMLILSLYCEKCFRYFRLIEVGIHSERRIYGDGEVRLFV